MNSRPIYFVLLVLSICIYLYIGCLSVQAVEVKHHHHKCSLCLTGRESTHDDDALFTIYATNVNNLLNVYIYS